MYCYKYPRPALTTDAIVFGFNTKLNQLQVLLIERKNPPFQGMYAFPGGFVDENETVEQCAKRELEEETSLKNVPLAQFYTFSKPDRDPRGRTVSVAFISIIDNTNSQIKGKDDAANAKWFNINQLPPLAFDHQDIMDLAVKTLISIIEQKLFANKFSIYNVFSKNLSKIDVEQLLDKLYIYARKRFNT